MSDQTTYANQIAVVKQECPDADEGEIGKEFARYEKDFLIPPEDALRSVIRKFQAATGVEIAPNTSTPVREEKKVQRFSELGADDRNVAIEVAVVSYTPRTQMVRGEEKQIAFGWIEDNPWEASSERVRWDYKDWGNKGETMIPGSVVRLEGASVNEWNDKRSINVNRTTRVTVLKEGGGSAPPTGNEPLSIARASEVEGFVNVVGRVLSAKPDVIVRKDGSGEIPIVRGKISDSSGSIGFLSWKDFEHKVGSLVKIVGASVRKFRETPEIQINDGTVIETYHDTAFPDVSELVESEKVSIADLRNGMREISITLQVESWAQRTFESQDGSSKTVRSGDVMDPTGRCRLTAWCEFDPKPGDSIRIEGGRVQFWQGSPDLVIDNLDQVSSLSDAPWEKIDPENHWVEVDLTSVTQGGSRRGISTAGTIVAINSGSGIIERCPDCRRMLRDGSCSEHGPQRGEEDLRLRFVLDNGVANANLFLGKEPAEEFLGMSMEEVKSEISNIGREVFVSNLKGRVLARKMLVHGRCSVDGQGAMLFADRVEIVDPKPAEEAKEVMERWEVVL
jgi:replication factor A1